MRLFFVFLCLYSVVKSWKTQKREKENWLRNWKKKKRNRYRMVLINFLCI